MLLWSYRDKRHRISGRHSCFESVSVVCRATIYIGYRCHVVLLNLTFLQEDSKERIAFGLNFHLVSSLCHVKAFCIGPPLLQYKREASADEAGL
ncbi:hypothetical protein C0J52_04850 [Blattella germanica]|nr:hypothetical protein C0J52_04850 [Blattella germanica]